MNGYLLVRANGARYGLPLDRVVEVVDGATAHPVAGARPAVRGVARLRGYLMPVVDLAALLHGHAAPTSASGTVVVTRCPAKLVALEVEDVDAVVRAAILPIPTGRTLPWAAGVAEDQNDLIPILDVESLGERLAAEEQART